VVRGGKVVERFVKEENKHCFPIFPRWNARTIHHEFKLEGWDYYKNCRDVKMRQLEVFQDPSVDFQSQESVDFEGIGGPLEQITVQQVMGDEPLHAKVLS